MWPWPVIFDLSSLKSHQTRNFICRKAWCKFGQNPFTPCWEMMHTIIVTECHYVTLWPSTLTLETNQTQNFIVLPFGQSNIRAMLTCRVHKNSGLTHGYGQVDMTAEDTTHRDLPQKLYYVYVYSNAYFQYHITGPCDTIINYSLPHFCSKSAAFSRACKKLSKGEVQNLLIIKSSISMWMSFS